MKNDTAGYADGVRRGGTLVTIRVMGQDRGFYEDILSMNLARPVSGNFDPSGMPVQLRELDTAPIKRS